MFRFLAVHLPQFRLERCGWRPDQPVVLLAEEKNALRVQCASALAQSRGVRSGMSISEARALYPELEQEMLDPEGEEADLEDLTLELLRVSPSIASLPPDGLVAEIERSAHLVGGERALLERVRIRLEQLGHISRLAVADGIGTARACARWSASATTVVVPGRDDEALHPLPLHALELPEEEHGLLVGLGIRTIGAFAALPAHSIRRRLGPAGLQAHELAKGGRSSVPLPPLTHEGPIVLDQSLPDPVIDLEALVFVLGSLLRDMAVRLALANEAASRVMLRFGLEDGTSQSVSMRLGTPSRNPSRILELLRRRLERFELAGPLVRVTLEAAETSPFRGRQRDLFGKDAGDAALGEVVALLADGLGAEAVVVPELVARHRPEAGWAPTAANARSVLSFGRLDPGHRRTDGSDPVHEWRGRPELVPSQRPPILLAPPLAVDARIEPRTSHPDRMRIDGRWLRVIEARGPEALEGEWWREGGFDRRYWIVRFHDGRLAWVYQDGDRWVLHGWWDR